MKTARASPPSRGESLLSLLPRKPLAFLWVVAAGKEPPLCSWAGWKTRGSPQPSSVFVLLQPALLEPAAVGPCPGWYVGQSRARAAGGALSPQELLPFSFQAPETEPRSLRCSQGCPCRPEGASQSPTQPPADRSTPPREESNPRLTLLFFYPTPVNPCLFPLASQTEGQTPPRPMSMPSNYSCSRAAVHGGGAALRD